MVSSDSLKPKPFLIGPETNKRKTEGSPEPGGRVRETWVVRDTTISPGDARSIMEKRSGATGVASTDT